MVQPAIHLRPIKPGGQPRVGSEDVRADLGLRYTDAFGYVSVVKAGDYGMMTLEGKRHLPASTMQEARYLFELHDQTPQDRSDARTH